MGKWEEKRIGNNVYWKMGRKQDMKQCIWENGIKKEYETMNMGVCV